VGILFNDFNANLNRSWTMFCEIAYHFIFVLSLALNVYVTSVNRLITMNFHIYIFICICMYVCILMYVFCIYNVYNLFNHLSLCICMSWLYVRIQYLGSFGRLINVVIRDEIPYIYKNVLKWLVWNRRHNRTQYILMLFSS